MPKIISNEIERTEEEALGTNGDIIERVEPVKKKRHLSEEQREKQRANLEKGRLALKEKREAAIQERAKMLHDSVVDAVPKPKAEDKKFKKILEAVGSIPAQEDGEPDEEIIIVKKRAPKKKTVIIQEEEEEEDPQQPPPPPAPTPKPKRNYTRKKTEEKIQTLALPVKQEPSLIFY